MDSNCHLTTNMEDIRMMQEHLQYVQELVKRGGLEKGDYDHFGVWLDTVAHQKQARELSTEDLVAIRAAFGDALSVDTLQGFALAKPHGYAGDFEMLDRIYIQHTASQAHLRKWDQYFHAHPATQAVRNRKIYFLKLLKQFETARISSGKERFDILNVASGSCRDLCEFFCAYPKSALFFDCLEYDPKAISFAKTLCHDHLSHIRFIQANALRYTTKQKYRLIWSAGLFDYFDDRFFISLLQRYWEMLEKDGELIIGNFSEVNPTRNYMEILGEWYLNHRSAEHLVSLAEAAEIFPSSITIDAEPLGINLFLRIKN